MNENKINPKFRAIDIGFSCCDNKLYDNDIYISSAGDIYEKAYPSYDTPNLEIECANRKLADVEISLDNGKSWHTMSQLKDFIDKNNTRTEDKRIEKALEEIEVLINATYKMITPEPNMTFDPLREWTFIKNMAQKTRSILKGETDV